MLKKPLDTPLSSILEVGDCRKVTLWERQSDQSSWITNCKKLSTTTDTVIVPNRITLQHCQKHRDKIEFKRRSAQTESTEMINTGSSKGENSRHSRGR